MYHIDQSPETMRAIAANPPVARTDLSTYWGRVQHYSWITSPLWWLSGLDRMEAARELVQRVHSRKTGYEFTPVGEYWYARRLQTIAYHPQTAEPLPITSRFDGMMPVNSVFAAFMATVPSQKSAPLLIALSVAQQAFVSGVTHYNRPLSSMNETETETASRLGLIALGCGLVSGSLQTMLNAKFRTDVRRFAASSAALAACVASLNLLLVRETDWTEGITVFDEDTGKALPEPSIEAGRVAVAQCLFTRALIAAVAAGAMPLVATWWLKGAVWTHELPPIAGTMLTTGFSSAIPVACFSPCSLALFPPTGELRIGERRVSFYKGL